MTPAVERMLGHYAGGWVAALHGLAPGDLRDEIRAMLAELAETWPSEPQVAAAIRAFDEVKP